MRVLLAAVLLAGCGTAPISGRTRFETYCAACHQPDGRGVPGGGPPLAGSPWVAGPESRLIRIVLHGVRGPIPVDGVTTDREMLGFGRILSDGEIAALLTFVRAEFGGAAPVSAESVRRARTPERTDYWTVPELLEIP